MTVSDTQCSLDITVSLITERPTPYLAISPRWERLFHIIGQSLAGMKLKMRMKFIVAPSLKWSV